MSTKTSTVQPAGRRTPLSLNAGTKPNNKPTNDKSDNKKETTTTTNNQKTDYKKDSQPERKPSTDKKQQPMTETRKPSSSSESKKQEDTKTKNEETKKNQNGVSSNGVKDKEKQSTNGGTVKPKTDATSGTSTPKRESQKSTDKKKESTAEVVAKETKNDDNKQEKNKEKASVETPKKQDEGKKEKNNTDEKPTEEKATLAKSPEKAKPAEEVINLDTTSPEGSGNITPVKAKKNEEIPAGTPVKGRKIEETPKKEEKQVCSPADQLDDVEMMEPLTFEAEPSQEISAASTPAKTYSYKEIHNRSAEKLQKTSPKSEIKPPRAMVTHTPDRKSCPRTLSSISGRRSIRPMGDYNFSGNLNIRESYRKINTELDFTSSSMNVTVGSEVPNNDSFSFFSRSRKRDRSSPSRQSAMEVQGDISPKSPKRARIELGVTGFFSAMASPITMLRARLSRATVQSTPKKQVDHPIEEDIVENVSGISIAEELTATEDLTVNPDSFTDNVIADNDPNPEEPDACSQKPTAEGANPDDDIKIKETITSTDTQAKKKCSIM